MIHYALEIPVVLFASGFLVTLALLVLLRYQFEGTVGSLLQFVPSVISILLLIIIGYCNVAHVGFLWPDEVNSLTISAAYLHGQPMYAAINAPVLYALLYGPVNFLFYTPFLVASAHCTAWIRLAILGMELLILATLYRIVRKHVSPVSALALLSLAVAAMVCTPRASLGVDPDAIGLLLLSLGALAALQGRWIYSSLGVALCGGLAVNCKITYAPIVCLLVVIVLRRLGVRAAMFASLTMLVVAALPFTLPQISIRNYLMWVLLIGHQGFSWELFFGNVLFAIFLLGGGILLLFCTDPKLGSRRHGYIVSTTFCLCLIADIVTGSKNGSGIWHLWPLIPFIMYWTAELVSSSRGMVSQARAHRILTAIAIASCIVTARYCFRDYRILRQPDRAQLSKRRDQDEAEIRQVVTRFKFRNVEMTSGNTIGDTRLDLRYELPLYGEQVVLDPVAYAETRKATANVPQGSVERALGCTDLWLTPHDELPFGTLNYNEIRLTVPYVYPDNLRLGYATNHRLLVSGRSFDIWGCPEN